MKQSSIIRSVQSCRREISRLCSELIQINTVNPPGDCSKIIGVLRGEYKKLGVDFFTISAERAALESRKLAYPRENFVASLGSSKKKVGLAIGTHMDVVPAGDLGKWKYHPFSGKITDGKIWGRGACDAKCSLVAQLYALKALVECNVSLDRSLLVIGTVDDEAPKDETWPGMRFVVRSGLRKLGFSLPMYAINAEASGLENIWGIFTGSVALKLAFHGRVGHPPVGINALEEAATFWANLIAREDVGRPRLSWLSGGSDSDLGLTPQLANMIIRTSFHKDSGSEEILQRIMSEIRSQEKQKNLPRTSIELLARQEAFDIGKKNILTSALLDASRTVGVRATYGGGIVGSGDLCYFLDKGIPGVTYGAGSLERCHVPNEFVTVEEIVKQSEIYALTALKLCS